MMDTARLALAALLALALPGCPSADDDDDTAANDDDTAANDDDTVGDDDDTVPTEISFTGEVIGRSAESGGVLSPDEWTDRSGALVVYLLPNPDDLTDVFWKTTMPTPGTFATDLPSLSGPLYATVIADCDGNSIIGNEDVRRDYASNPVQIGAMDLDLVLEIEVPEDCRGGGGGGPDESPTTTISGPVTLMNVAPAPIAITASSEASGHMGWWRFLDAGATEYSVTVRDYNGPTNIVGYHDGDGNGLFEPSDNTGGLTSNPVVLGIGDIEGAELLIPDGEPLDLSLPEPPVTLAGDVVFDGYTSGDILVRASAGSQGGQLYASQTLPGPGPFSLTVPAQVQGMVVWAVEDPEADGAWNPNVDASDLVGPFNTTVVDEIGVTLDLEEPPVGAGSLSGTITVEPASGPNDRVLVLLIDSPDPGAPPIASVAYGNPGGSVEYSFTGLDPDTYSVRAWLDYDSDLSLDLFAPQPDEATGGTGGVLLAPGADVVEDFTIEAIPE